jgi:hypothetical protein
VVESARAAAEAEESAAAAEAAAADGSPAADGTTTEDAMADKREEGGHIEQHAASVELDPEASDREVEPSDAMIAEGYDEAAGTRPPFLAEDLSPDNILGTESADPVVVTEVEQMSADELLLQGAGRDLRPDTITPAPDISSSEAAVLYSTGSYDEETRPSTLADETTGVAGPVVHEGEGDDSEPMSPRSAFATEASAPEVQISSEPSPASEGEPAPVENVAEADDAAGNTE